MTPEEFEEGLIRVASIQREAGWSYFSIDSYAKELRAICGDGSGVAAVGAGLAQDNTRHGVYCKPKGKQA